MSSTVPNIRTRKPRVGLFMTAGDWFWEIAGDPEKSFSGLAKLVEDAADKIRARLGKTMEIIDSGIVRNPKEAVTAVEKFNREDIDLVVTCCLIWSEDQPIHELLRRIINVPLVLWCYQIEGTIPEPMDEIQLFKLCGPVGTLQNSGVLKKAGWDNIGFVFGPSDDPQCIDELNDYAEAARLAKDLRSAVIGHLPYRNYPMMSTYVDEFRLATEVGPTVQHISVAEYKKRIDSVTEKEVADYIADLKNRFKIHPDVDEDNLYRSTKISLGLAKVVEDYNLDGVALQDLEPELHEVVGTRPCLTMPRIFNRGCVVTMEGEIGACLAMIFQRQFSGESPMYVEVFCYDIKRNLTVTGHAGIHDSDSLAAGDDDVTITTDFEYDQLNELKGAWNLFTAKPGPVTLLSVVDSKDCFQMTMAKGQSVDNKQILFGNPNMNVRFDVSLREFFEQAARAGVTQHFAVAYGDTTGKLLKLAQMLSMRAVVIE